MMNNKRQYNGELGINADSFRVQVTEYSRLPREVQVSIDKFISPERGIDYWTIQDQQYIIDQVISKIPKQEGGSVEGYLYNGVFYKDSQHQVVIEGEEEKIYVELLTNKVYRWSNGSYIEISPSLTIGETSDTAFAGNRGVVLENEILDKIEYEGLDSPSIDNIAVFGDSEGNIKDSLTGINDIALDEEVVHINGDESISGSKSFSSKQTFNDGVTIEPYLEISEKNSTVILSCKNGSLFLGDKEPVIISNISWPKEKTDAANMEYVETKYEKPSKGIPYKDLDSGIQASLDKADSAIQTEKDPTVPRWAKEKNKPQYDYREIQNTPDLSGFITSSDIPVTDVTVGGTSVVSNGVAVVPSIPTIIFRQW